MSAIPSSGLVGVSTQTILVWPGRIAARTDSMSAILAIVCSTPQVDSTLLNSR